MSHFGGWWEVVRPLGSAGHVIQKLCFSKFEGASSTGCSPNWIHAFDHFCDRLINIISSMAIWEKLQQFKIDIDLSTEFVKKKKKKGY